MNLIICIIAAVTIANGVVVSMEMKNMEYKLLGFMLVLLVSLLFYLIIKR